MGGMIWVVAIAAVVLSVAVLRRASRLAKDVDRLKREQYYTESRVKRVAEDLREMVEPLRVHLAAVAEGARVPRETILNGRLYRDLSAEEAERALEQAGQEADGDDGVVLVDVRTPREYAVRHIPGARLVPFDELEARYDTDIPRTAAQVIVYCQAGERSRSACELLGRRGYTNLANMKEGLQGWRGPTEGEGHVSLIQIQSHRKAASSI